MLFKKIEKEYEQPMSTKEKEEQRKYETCELNITHCTRNELCEDNCY